MVGSQCRFGVLPNDYVMKTVIFSTLVNAGMTVKQKEEEWSLEKWCHRMNGLPHASST